MQVVSLLETKHTSAECKELLEDGKGEDSSNPVQNVVNEYASAVTFKQVMKVTSTENQVLSSGSTGDMVIKKEISHGDVKVHTPLQIPVSRSASAVTSKQGVKIADTVNHVTGSPTYIAKVKVTSTENQVLSSAPTADMVVADKISPLQIPVPRSASNENSKQAVEIAGTVNHVIDSSTHMTKMKVASTENQVLGCAPTDDMVIKKEITYGDVKVYFPLQIPVSRSDSAVTSKQDVKIASTVNHIIDSPTHVTKMKVTSTENQVLSSTPTDEMVIKKEITYKDVKVYFPLQIPVSRSDRAVTSIKDVEISGTVSHVIDSPTHMTKMKVSSTEKQVLSSAPTVDMVIKKEKMHGDAKIYSPVTSKQDVEIGGTVSHVIGSPTHMAKRVPDCMLVEDTSPYNEVEMHKPFQAQEPLSAVASESTVNVVTVDHVFSGPVHIIEIVTNMDETHVQSVHVDIGMQTDPLSEWSPLFDTMTLCMKRKLVEQDHSYCKKKLEPSPKEPECTTNHDVKDEAEQNIDSSDDEWEDEIRETDIDYDSDEDWVPEDEEFDSDNEEFDSDDGDLHF